MLIMEKTIYLDNAATTFPKPEEVYLGMDQFYRELGVNVGRGQHKLASKAANLMQETRELLLNLFHSENKSIVFTHTATEALNLLLTNLVTPECNLYISPFEHNAVTRLLEKFKATRKIKVFVLPFNLQNWEYDYDEIQCMFTAARPNLMIISHASNVCGYISPIFELCELAKKYSSINVIDMCQTAGLLDLDLSTDNIDYAVFDGHKTLYGPFGIGGIVGKSFSNFEPIIYGGTGVESANQNMPDLVPERFEAGSHNIQAIAGLNIALKWIQKNSIAQLYEKEKKNYEMLLTVLNRHDNIKIISGLDKSKFIGVVSSLFDNYSSDNIGNILSQHNIAVRTGLHCAPLAHKTLGTYPAGTVRFSVGWFNSESDFVALDKVLSFIEENS